MNTLEYIDQHMQIARSLWYGKTSKIANGCFSAAPAAVVCVCSTTMGKGKQAMHTNFFVVRENLSREFVEYNFPLSRKGENMRQV